MNVIGRAAQIFLEGKACVRDTGGSGGYGAGRSAGGGHGLLAGSHSLRFLGSAGRFAQGYSPITPGAFVFPEAGEDVAASDETKGASQAALLSPLYIAMKSTDSQMSLFYMEVDQYCMAPISKRKGGVYKLCGSKSVGVGACSLASHVKQRDPRFKVGKGLLGISVPNGTKVDRADVFQPQMLSLVLKDTYAIISRLLSSLEQEQERERDDGRATSPIVAEIAYKSLIIARENDSIAKRYNSLGYGRK
eukprot:scaffold19253_cov49-Attheya_sp.AAC.1